MLIKIFLIFFLTFNNLLPNIIIEFENCGRVKGDWAILKIKNNIIKKFEDNADDSINFLEINDKELIKYNQLEKCNFDLLFSTEGNKQFYQLFVKFKNNHKYIFSFYDEDNDESQDENSVNVIDAIHLNDLKSAKLLLFENEIENNEENIKEEAPELNKKQIRIHPESPHCIIS